MRHLNLARKLKLALAGLVGGFAFACGNPAPREVPPLAPRPEPMTPSPSGPVPGAPDPIPAPVPDPLPSDAATPTTLIEPPRFRSAATPPSDAAPAQVVDAGVDAELPPVPDGGLPPDASKRPE